MGLLSCFLLAFCLLSCSSDFQIRATEATTELPTVVDENKAEHVSSGTTPNKSCKLEGLCDEQYRNVMDGADKNAFQAEVSRMMNIIINSLYTNKEIFLRELISNASDALDKIRLLSLTDSDVLKALTELCIRVKVDKENNMLHITDTGIGMTRDELVKHLGTIAKSGTSDFFSKMSEQKDAKDLNALIGQFGVGFYSVFLVADKVIVTSKHNDDDQYIWESDSNNFRIIKDPRGNTLLRGTTISLILKDGAKDFLEVNTLRDLIRKYSQFINFPIYLWESKTEEVEESTDDKAPEEKSSDEEESDSEKKETEDDVEVEEEKKADETNGTKKVSKTVWDWARQNEAKPIWTRKPGTVDSSEINEFYRVLSKDTRAPLTHAHFSAEGEIGFKSLLFIPSVAPSEVLRSYGSVKNNIKLYVRRVFITDDFKDMMPNYLSFVTGVVDSDDLPLNVGRENLQQHKLLKIIKRKIVRKAIDSIKQLNTTDFDKFWSEYSTNIKLGVFDDTSNRMRLAKLLRFHSSADKSNQTALSDYVSRMRDGQTQILFIACSERKECENSPFVERVIKRKYEVLYLSEPIDEYTINSLSEFEGKKFQNLAKEGLKLGDEDEELHKELEERFKPLTKWLMEHALSGEVSSVAVSTRLTHTPCALVASQFGWSGNMERLASAQTHTKANDPSRNYYGSQKKALEINPRHPIIKELLSRVETHSEEFADGASEKSELYTKSVNLARMLYQSTVIRSGFQLKDTARFADDIDGLMRQSAGLSLDEKIEEEVFDDAPVESDASEAKYQGADDDHEEL